MNEKIKVGARYIDQYWDEPGVITRIENDQIYVLKDGDSKESRVDPRVFSDESGPRFVIQ